MKSKEATAKRHLVVSNTQPKSFKDWASILYAEFRPKKLQNTFKAC